MTSRTPGRPKINWEVDRIRDINNKKFNYWIHTIQRDKMEEIINKDKNFQKKL